MQHKLTFWVVWQQDFNPEKQKLQPLQTDATRAWRSLAARLDDLI